jgi:hypothetical protein
VTRNTSTPPRRSSTTPWPRAISATGEVLEINRIASGDCSHATFNVEGIFDIAETAWHQGTDLYANPRLPLGLEYMAKLLTTGAATTSVGTVMCGTKPASIEIAYNHYANRVGKPPLVPVVLGGLVRNTTPYPPGYPHRATACGSTGSMASGSSSSWSRSMSQRSCDPLLE